MLRINRGRFYNNQGVVLMTVIIIIAIMMVLTVSLISINVSQNVVNQNQIKKIKCELLNDGRLAQLNSRYFKNDIVYTADIPSDDGEDDRYKEVYVDVLGKITYTSTIEIWKLGKGTGEWECKVDKCPVKFNCEFN